MNMRNRGWGQTQQQRFNAALLPASAPLDERTPAQLMAMAQRYAALIQFYQLNGEASKDNAWALFFASDISFLLADVAATTDPAGVGKGIDLTLPKQIYALAERVNAWYVRITDYQNTHLSQAISPLSDTLNAVIADQLAPQLALLDTHPEILAAVAAGAPPDLPAPPGLAAIWQQTPPLGVPPRLQAIAANFRAASEKINRLAHEYLDASLEQNDHAPHTALYLAFLELFRIVQGDMNQFTARHLEYYYRTVLALRPKASEGDSVTLAVTLANTCPGFTLPAGSLVSAGKDIAGNPIQYSTDSDAPLNQAAIQSLSSLFFGRAPAAGSGQAAPPVTYINAAPVADSQDGLGAPLLSPEQGWDTFGIPGAAPGLAAEIGLLIASPVLLLQQGIRVITLNLTFDAGDTVPGLDMFSFYLSGAAGWQAVTPLVSETPPTSQQLPNELQLVFALAADAPAVVPNAKLTPGIDSGLPMIKLALNAGSGAYTALRQTAILSIDIAVTVSGLTDLQLENDGGKIAAGKPFAPFGSTPQPGNSFQLSHPELAGKQISDVTVDVTWLNLPLPEVAVGGKNGFPQYYAGYDPYLFPNAGFTAAISVYGNGAWQMQQTLGDSPSTSFCIFTDVGGTVQAGSAYEFDPAVPAPAVQVPAGTAAPASMPGADGAVRIALSAPSYGFGHAQFQKLFAAAAIENIKIIEAEINPPPAESCWTRFWKWLSGLFGKKSASQTDGDTPPPPQLVMLNPPFTPMIKALSLGYSASASVPMLQQASAPPQLWHIHPFGYALPAGPTLYPVYPDDGYLFLGLKQIVPGQPLSLHFEFRESPGSAVHVGPDVPPSPAIDWRYLSGNQWQPFPAGSVSSSLDNFSGSGIVTLQIPADIDPGDPGDTMMSSPAGISWLSVSVGADPAAYSATVAILTQVASATRVVGPDAGVPPLPLAPASITGLSAPLTSVKSVAQPYPSQGGRPAESEHAYRVRVAERLRHKQRASQPGDYEQIVLEAFPAVWQIKCIGAFNSKGFNAAPQIRPGRVVLAVAPPSCAHPEAVAPMPTPVLTDIADAVQAVASPFVRDICVRNISYDLLQVVASVRFATGQNSVQCIKQLNAALCAALSPAAGATHLEIGCGEMAISKIAGVIEGQSYVAALDSLYVMQSPQDGTYTPLKLMPGQIAYTQTPWSVLVSAPQHVITVSTAQSAAIAASGGVQAQSEILAAAPPVPVPRQYWLAIPSDSLAA